MPPVDDKSLDENDLILRISKEIKSLYPNSFRMCESMSKRLFGRLKDNGIRARRVTGMFHMDEPGGINYITGDEDEGFDEYSANHDWITIEGKILDISADQFRKFVDDDIPDIVFIGYTDPLYVRYEELGNV